MTWRYKIIFGVISSFCVLVAIFVMPRQGYHPEAAPQSVERSALTLARGLHHLPPKAKPYLSRIAAGKPLTWGQVVTLKRVLEQEHNRESAARILGRLATRVDR